MAAKEIDSKSAKVEKLQEESDIVCGYFQDNDSDATGDLSLDVLTKFHKIYEENLKKLEQTDNSYQMQVSMLKRWVNDLTEQNALLVHTVKELEKEATKRVHLLEERIIRDENKHVQVQQKMENEIRQHQQMIMCKDNDLKCLIEVLRRLRESECLTLDDLHFYEVTDSHIFGRREGDVPSSERNVATLLKRPSLK